MTDLGIQLQNSVENRPLRVDVSTQENETFPRTGQHVAVVIVETPRVSWHASAYPDGQIIPGEKYEADANFAPEGRQEVIGSTMLMPLLGA